MLNNSILRTCIKAMFYVIILAIIGGLIIEKVYFSAFVNTVVTRVISATNIHGKLHVEHYSGNLLRLHPVITAHNIKLDDVKYKDKVISISKGNIEIRVSWADVLAKKFNAHSIVVNNLDGNLRIIPEADIPIKQINKPGFAVGRLTINDAVISITDKKGTDTLKIDSLQWDKPDFYNHLYSLIFDSSFKGSYNDSTIKITRTNEASNKSVIEIHDISVGDFMKDMHNLRKKLIESGRIDIVSTNEILTAENDKNIELKVNAKLTTPNDSLALSKLGLGSIGNNQQDSQSENVVKEVMLTINTNEEKLRSYDEFVHDVKVSILNEIIRTLYNIGKEGVIASIYDKLVG